jgi:hypothetical protein
MRALSIQKYLNSSKMNVPCKCARYLYKKRLNSLKMNVRGNCARYLYKKV